MQSILQFSLMDSVDFEALIVYVRGRYELRLMEAKNKNPDADYSENEKIIEYMRKMQDTMNSIYNGNKFLLKESVKSATIITDLENEKWRLQQKVEAQRIEIENLKTSII